MTQLTRIKTDIKTNIESLAGNMQGGQVDPNDASSQKMAVNMQTNLGKYSNQLNTINAEYIKLCEEYTKK